MKAPALMLLLVFWEVRLDSTAPVLVVAEFIIKLFVYNSSSTLTNLKKQTVQLDSFI